MIHPWSGKYFEKMFGANRNNNTMSEAVSLKHNHMPPLLYKYRSVSSRTIDDLLNFTVTASRVETFNDIFEAPLVVDETHAGKWILDQFHQEICRQTYMGTFGKPIGLYEFEQIVSSGILNSNPRFSEVTEKINKIKENLISDNIKKITQEYRKMYNVFCLTERHDNELMWAHYAGNHTGICIGYPVKSLAENEPISQKTLPVRYTDENVIKIDNFELEKVDYGSIAMQAYSVKSTAWSYEKEWRTFFLSRDIRQTEKFIKPEIVYLGARIDNVEGRNVIAACAQNNIKVMKMTPDMKKRKLIPVDI